MRSISILIIYLMFTTSVQGQTFNTNGPILTTNKTIGYLTGTSYIVGLGISANLEFPIFQEKVFSLNLKGAYGISVIGELNGTGSLGFTYATLSSVILLEKGRSKFEITAGVGSASSTGSRDRTLDGLIPNLGLGVRYYWDDYIVRGGIAFPELLNVSYGWYF